MGIINKIRKILGLKSVKTAEEMFTDLGFEKGVDFLQVPGTGSEYIQINHDLRTLKNSLNNCIRRVNLLTKEIRGDK